MAAVHLLGAGAVGRAWLRLWRGWDPDGRLVGATDRSGSVYHAGGLPIDALVAHKERGMPLMRWPGPGRFEPVAAPSAEAHLLADATPSDRARGPGDASLLRRWLSEGRAAALASKHAAAEDPLLLFERGIGVNAVLGGTGARLQAELPLLRERWRSVSLAGSISTSVVVEAIERGKTFEEGVADAQAIGVLEPDPDLDLRGADAAVKLSVVAGALLGRPILPSEVVTPHLRTLDPESIREAAKRGQTTRLVGRASREGELSLGWEILDRSDPLTLGPAEVVYAYRLDDGDEIVHRGRGLGAIGTALALDEDVRRLSGP